MKSYLFKRLIVLGILLSFLMPLMVGAVTIENPIKYGTFPEVIDAITNFIFWVAVSVAPAMIIIGGFYFVTAAGNPERIERAKKIILYTVIGLAIVLLAKGLVAVIRQAIGG